MARPRKYDDDALLESLRATFFELGPGASSQELAKRAGVSEGTLFKRFGTKRKLFQQAMRMPALEEQVWMESMPLRVGKGSLEGQIADLALALMGYISEIIPIMQTVMSSGKLKPQDLRSVIGDEDVPPDIVRDRFATYFRGEIAEGRMRPCDAHTLADFVVGACLKHVHLLHHFGELPNGDTLEQASRRFARSVVELAGVGRSGADAESARVR